MTGSTPLRLKANGIFKSYGAVNALSDVHFELRAGEVMALLGENGAGKSTIVKVISGLVSPDNGTIEVDGTPADISSVSLSQAAGIAVVQQEFSTVGTMTVAQNLVLGQQGAPWWWSPRRLNDNAVAILERVGLAGLNPRTAVEELSVAEMQLLEIARVLAATPRSSSSTNRPQRSRTPRSCACSTPSSASRRRDGASSTSPTGWARFSRLPTASPFSATASAAPLRGRKSSMSTRSSP